MTKNLKEQVNAYSGKYVTIGKKTYSLTPESTSKGCKGCALERPYTKCYETFDSTENVVITDLCRQGFILKKVEL